MHFSLCRPPSHASPPHTSLRCLLCVQRLINTGAEVVYYRDSWLMRSGPVHTWSTLPQWQMVPVDEMSQSVVMNCRGTESMSPPTGRDRWVQVTRDLFIRIVPETKHSCNYLSFRLCVPLSQKDLIWVMPDKLWPCTLRRQHYSITQCFIEYGFWDGNQIFRVVHRLCRFCNKIKMGLELINPKHLLEVVVFILFVSFPSSGQNLILSESLVYDQIFEKTKTPLPSALSRLSNPRW